MKQRIQFIVSTFIAFILLTKKTSAQELDNITTHIAKSLIGSGTDTVLIYKPFDGPMVYRSTDTSNVLDIQYVITKKSDSLTIERLTYEIVYGHGDTITHHFLFKHDSLGIFNYLGKNFKSIFSDTLRPGMLKHNFNGKDTLIRHRPSHSGYAGLVVQTAAGTFVNHIYHEDLVDGIILNVDGSFRSRQESVNYEYNISTSIYKIFTLLQIVEKEIQKRFEY